MGRPFSFYPRRSLLLAIALLSACSNKQIYSAIQDNQRFECSKMPEAQAEECLRQFDRSYKDYEEDLQSRSAERK